MRALDLKKPENRRQREHYVLEIAKLERRPYVYVTTKLKDAPPEELGD